MSGPGLEEAVASVLEERTGRRCLFVPSMATLVERTSRYVTLVALPEGGGPSKCAQR